MSNENLDPEDVRGTEQTLAEQIEQNCDPNTDTDTYNHRFDADPAQDREDS